MTNFDRDPATGLNAALAAELRAERAAKHMTIADLAERSGVSRSTLIRMLNAARPISVVPLQDLSEVLGVKTSCLLARAERRLAADQEITPRARHRQATPA